MTATAETFDIRELLDEGTLAFFDEDGWLSEHEGCLGASRIGGCLRQEKFRLLRAPRVDHTTERQRRRMLAGRMFGELEYRKLLKAGRRPRKEVEVRVEVEGITILGKADLVMPEGVTEIKTTERHSMDREFLPFPNVVQLGTYMYALQKPGTLLYIADMGGTEHLFDFPELPEVWEPHVQAVGRLFADHPGDDVLAFPAERLYCESCPYLDICPAEEPGTVETLEEPHRSLLSAALMRWQEANRTKNAAEKEEKGAKEAVLGFRPFMRMTEKGSVADLGRQRVIITDRTRSALDQAIARGLLEGAGIDVPMKESTYPIITVREAE